MAHVPTVKYCERCYKKISDAYTSDWYSHIRIMYCDECRDIVRKEKAAERIRKLREKNKIKEQEKKAYVKDLELEIEVLRGKVKILMEGSHV